VALSNLALWGETGMKNEGIFGNDTKQ